MPFVSVSKRVFESFIRKGFGLTPFAYEWFYTKDSFEREAQCNLSGRFNIAGNSKGCGMSKHFRRKKVIPPTESPNKKHLSSSVISDLFESKRVTHLESDSLSSCV